MRDFAREELNDSDVHLKELRAVLARDPELTKHIGTIIKDLQDGARCDMKPDSCCSRSNTVQGRRHVKLPWKVPTFGEDGLPSTFDNPYIPEPERHAATPMTSRHADLSSTPRHNLHLRANDDGASSPFVFPLLISSMLIVGPVCLLALAGMLLLDWRGGAAARWSH